MARALVRADPGDARALGLLGVILDAERKYGEAEGIYLQALRLAPDSAALHNNLGNHYLAKGDLARARAQFLKVVEIDSGHPNANLQLAEMSLKANDGTSALKYLSHLPASALAQPAPALLHAQALHLAGKKNEAEQALDQIAQQAGSDPRTAFSVGMVDAAWKRYGAAEQAFGQALKADPANFDIQYNLGLAALNARDYSRALVALEAARRQKPGDPDVLLNLARTYSATERDDQAIALLVQAMKEAPGRPDILMSAAQTSERLGFYVDAAGALEKYVKLKPGDEVARRELGFLLARTSRLDDGVRILSAYVDGHPKDPQGLYELGVAESVRDNKKALAHLDAALALEPSLSGARYARAVIVAQQGNYEESISDLRKILETEPRNTNALYTLGDDLLKASRPDEAVKALAQAAEVAPKDPKILLRYSQALMRAGNPTEAQDIIRRFKALNPSELGSRPNAGLFDYLSLTPQQQHERYMKNLRHNVELNPNDVKSLRQMANALLLEGKTAEAVEDYKKIQTLSGDPKVLAGCGRELLDAGQYVLAREFLTSAMKEASSSDEASVENL
ncbi:MAG TPA: tetratricopeptide repeat protein, partial [Terriglobia bacterium]|nr:tetratricopeptide repeat protein [Terriglobia bacterium]